MEHFGSVAWPQHAVHIPPVAMAADNGAAVTGSASARSAFAIWLNKESVIRALSVASAQAVTRVAGTRRESGKQPDHAK